MQNNGYLIDSICSNQIRFDLLSSIQKKLEQFDIAREVDSPYKLAKLSVTDKTEKVFKKAMHYTNRQIKISDDFAHSLLTCTSIHHFAKCLKIDADDLVVFHEYSENENDKQIDNGHHYRENFAGFRIVRPNSNVSGIHQDDYRGTKALEKKVISVWIPLIGYDERTTLRIFPKSHLVHHDSTNYIKDDFIAQSFSKDYVSQFESTRLRLKKNEAIIFHPLLLHGGSTNATNFVRVSIELRITSRQYIDDLLISCL